MERASTMTKLLILAKKLFSLALTSTELADSLLFCFSSAGEVDVVREEELLLELDAS